MIFYEKMAKYHYDNLIATLQLSLEQKFLYLKQYKRKNHSVIGFLQPSSPLHLQYLQHLIPATLQRHPFLRAHLPHMHGSGRPSGLVITISGIKCAPSFKTITLGIHSKGGISKWCFDPQLLLVIGSANMFLCVS